MAQSHSYPSSMELRARSSHLVSDETEAVPTGHQLCTESLSPARLSHGDSSSNLLQDFSGHWPPSSSPPLHMPSFRYDLRKDEKINPRLFPPAVPCSSWAAAAVTQCSGLVLFLDELKLKHLPRINQPKPLPLGLCLLRQRSSPFLPGAQT